MSPGRNHLGLYPWLLTEQYSIAGVGVVGIYFGLLELLRYKHLNQQLSKDSEQIILSHKNNLFLISCSTIY